MNLNQEIYKVLSSAGQDGLSAKKISLHVYNACNDLFHSTNYDEVNDYVLRFLKRHSKHEPSFVEKSSKRGCYRLKEITNDLFPNWFEDEIPTENVTVIIEKDEEVDSPTLFTEEEMNSRCEINEL